MQIPGASRRAFTVIIALGLLSAPCAYAFELDFAVDDQGSVIAHGQVIDDEYSAYGVDISALNGGGGPDLAAVYNPGETNGADPDLQQPFSQASGWTWNGSDWASADISGQEQELLNPSPTRQILIVQENDSGCNDGICANADDQAGGPNFLVFEFDQAMTLDRLDIFDVDTDEGAKIAFFSSATPSLPTSAEYDTFDSGSDLIASYAVSSDQVGGSAGANGDHGAARFFFGGGVENVRRMVVAFTSSGAVTGLVGTTSVPEPGTLALLGVALAGMARVQRSRRST